MTTIKRRRKTKIRSPKAGDMAMIMEQYAKGVAPKEIAKENNWESVILNQMIKKYMQGLRNIHETRQLIQDQEVDDSTIKSKTLAKTLSYKSMKEFDSNINELFMSKLSDPLAHLLTEDEVNYCYLIVHENDWESAMVSSGLDDGLLKSNNGYDRALKLRHLYLRRKPNVAKYINELQMKNLKDINLDKEYIQANLLKRIAILEEQNDPRLEPSLSRYYQMLGQSTGAFTEKIQIEEVSLDDVILKMKRIRAERNKEIESVFETPDIDTYVSPKELEL